MRAYFNKSGGFQIFEDADAECWSSRAGGDCLYQIGKDWVFFSFDAMMGMREGEEVTDEFALRWLALNNHKLPESLAKLAKQFLKT